MPILVCVFDVITNEITLVERPRNYHILTTDKQTNKQTNKQTHKQTNKLFCKKSIKYKPLCEWQIYPFWGAIYRTCFLDQNTASMVSEKKVFPHLGAILLVIAQNSGHICSNIDTYARSCRQICRYMSVVLDTLFIICYKSQVNFFQTQLFEKWL